MGRPGQGGNRHTQKLPCSIWAVPTCGGGGRDVRVRRYLASDLNGRIGGRRGRKNWRQMHHADEGAATPVATEGGGRGYGNSANRGKQALESATRASPPPQSPLDPQEFPTSPSPLSPLAYCYSFALPKTYNNTTGSLSLFTPSFFQPDGAACVSAIGPS